MVGEKHIWSKSLDENNGDEGNMRGGESRVLEPQY